MEGDKETSSVRILHLSDLHFGTKEDAKTWYSQLAHDLKSEDLKCEKLDILLVSGDIGTASKPEEYDAAKLFFDLLCPEFGLDASRLVLVPGNHDLDRELSEDGYELMDVKKCRDELKKGNHYKESESVVRLRVDDKYRKRFEHFAAFCKKVTGHPYPEEYAEQAILHRFQEHGLVILALNSCWETDTYFKKRTSIHPGAVPHALDTLRKGQKDAYPLRWAVWHHPLHSAFDDRIRDHGFLEQLAKDGFSVCFHGHLHKEGRDFFRYDQVADGRHIDIICAGTFGSDRRRLYPGHALQYNLLTLEGNALTVETRRRLEPNGAWQPYATWLQGPGKDPLPRYTITLSSGSGPRPVKRTKTKKRRSSKPQGEKQQASDAEIVEYCQKAQALHEHLPRTGFRTRIRVPIRIEDIYVPLRAMIDTRAIDQACFADAEDAERCLKDRGGSLEISVPHAFFRAEEMQCRGLVILGDPGSGKTTHLKRILLWCLQGGLKEIGLPENVLPVFLPLRELKDLGRGFVSFVQEQLDKRDLGSRSGLGERLLERGNLLFLLDGLDEVSDPRERVRVSRWIEDAMTVRPSCRFVVSCRFAGYTQNARLSGAFMELHLRPLTAEQAETFIRHWYRIVETGLSTDRSQAETIADRNADDLIERLKAPEFRARRVFELTRNPLLLANLCLVHKDRGNLPQTRARLYEECTEVLLELWRGAAGVQQRIKAQTARRVLQPAALWLHQEEGRTRAKAEELAPVIASALESSGWTFGSAQDFLEAVRNESGLLTGWDQEHYGFMHLGFQEYLAAREIQNLAFRDRSVLRELAARFGESWWQEVILLALALDNPSLFEEFMREVVKRGAFAAHTDMVTMCLDEAAEVTTAPFIELLEAPETQRKGEDKGLWERQMAALQVLEQRQDPPLERLFPLLRDHPDGRIRAHVLSRMAEATQAIAGVERGRYELVLIPGGEFLMGSPESEEGRWENESPLHEVTVKGFYMGRYPVTNEQYGLFLSESSNVQEPESWGDRQFNQPRQPVVGVSWQEARRYAEWAGLRLPAEAEWEYACRAGTKSRYYTGHSEEDLGHAGWYSGNSGGKTHPVGEKEPNAFGLYDMHGNVLEWVEDDYHPSYDSAPSDGSAWVDRPIGSTRVVRGGSWNNRAGYCRSALRSGWHPDSRNRIVGFRLVRSLP